MRFATALFDLDGTLIDSIGLIVDSYHHTLAVHGFPPRSDADWIRGIGTPLTAQLSEYGEDEATLAAMIATYRAYNIANHDARVRAYPGIPEVIRDLHAAGVHIGIVTSKNRSGTERGLRVAAITEFVRGSVGADDVTHHKPHREPVDRALALLEADRENTVFIGDSVHDMRSGRASGVQTAAALWGPFSRDELARAEPDAFLERPDDLRALILADAASPSTAAHSPE